MTVRVWTPERSLDVRSSIELKGHTESVETLAWDPTHPERLATASTDKSVRLYDIRSGSSIMTTTTPGANINLSFHPKGQLLAVGDRNDILSLIDIRAGGKILGTIRPTPPQAKEEIHIQTHEGLAGRLAADRAEGIEEPLRALAAELDSRKAEGTRTVLVAPTVSQLERLQFLLSSYGFSFRIGPTLEECLKSEAPLAGLVGVLSDGFVDVDHRISILLDEQILGSKRKKSHARAQRTFSSDLLIDAKLRRFYTHWCYKEAYIKMDGEALLAKWIPELEFKNPRAPKMGTVARCSTHGTWGERVSDVEVWFQRRRLEDVRMEIQAFEENYMIGVAAKPAGKFPDGLTDFVGLYLESDVMDFARSS